MTLVEKGGWLRRDWKPAKFVLRRSGERPAEAGQEEMCMQLVRFAACRMKELDRGIERRNDFERTSALFGHLAMDGAEGPLPGFEPAARKKQPELVDNACHLELSSRITA